MKKIVWFSIFACCSLAVWAGQDSDTEAFTTKGAINLFETGCLTHYPNPRRFNAWIRNFNTIIKPLAAQSRNYINVPKDAEAYTINIRGINYILVAGATNFCAVHARQVNAEIADKAFSALLDQYRQSGIVEKIYKESQSTSEGFVHTTSYEYRKQDQWIITFTVSKSGSTHVETQYVISVTSQLRKNNLIRGH